MPNKDRTGPQGKGPRTGRQMGDCAQKGQEELEEEQPQEKEDLQPRRGRNQRPRDNKKRGRGFGFGRRFRQNEE